MNRMYRRRIETLCLALFMLLCLPLQTFAVEPETETLPDEPAAVDEAIPEEEPGGDGVPEPVPVIPETPEPEPEPDGLLLEGSARVKLFQNGDLDGEQTIPGEAELFDNDELYNFIYQSFLDKTAQIDVERFQSEESEFVSTYGRVVNDHPELFYVTGGYVYSKRDGIIIGVTPTYYDKLAAPERRTEFDEAVQNVLARIDGTMSPLEKAVALHDYLVLNCFYNKAVGADLSLGPAQVGYEPWTAYGALVNGDPVCEGYSLAYKYLLNQVGIESILVSSEKLHHAWNLVQLDNEWYHVDVTWDDPMPDVVGRCLYNNFLRSDPGIASTEHDGWETLIKCNSTKYESGYVFNGLSLPVYWCKGQNYYVTKTAGSDIDSYDICAGPLKADPTQTKIVKSIEVFINAVPGDIYFLNNFGIAWAEDSLCYVKPDRTLTCFNLSRSNERELGTIDFEPTEAIINDKPTLRYDTILLQYKDGKIQAVSKVENQLLGEFNVAADVQTMLGDVNKDGRVTDGDWTAVAKYLADWNGDTDAEIDLTAADVNEDASVTSVDRMILARHLAEWEGYGELPYAPSPAATQSDPDSSDPNAPKIVVNQAFVQEDGTADVIISLENNPGVVSMLLRVSFDETALTLENVTDAGVLGTEPMHSDKRGTPYTLSWTNDTADANLTANGTIVTLRFRLKEDAAEDSYPIAVQYASEKDEILDKDMDPVSFQVVDGAIQKKTEPSLGTIQANGGTLCVSIENLAEESKLAFAFYNGEQFLGVGVQDITEPGTYAMENPYGTATRAAAMLLSPEWQILCTKVEADLTPPDEAELGIAAMLTDSEGNILCIKREAELMPLPE